MSYILDALRRADADRERGQVPGLLTPGLDGVASAASRLNPQPWAPWALAAVGLGAAVALAWWSFGRGTPATPQAAPVAAAAAPAAVPAVPTVAGAAAVGAAAQMPAAVPPPPPAAVAPNAGPAASLSAALPPAPNAPPHLGGAAAFPPAPGPVAAGHAEARKAPPVSPAPPRPAQTPAAAPRPAPRAAAVPPREGREAQVGRDTRDTRETRETRSGERPGAEASAPAQAHGAAPLPIVALADLSPQQRAEWPALAIGGTIYSKDAASRFVLINGQVVREGETVAPGVVMERILPRKAVLRWRDMRVELPL